ncbi:uncharacterized protein LOC124650143 [Lolium rigidum]|uniref:uncharacterized protein LOC124650143 n=1 Tax=Lolium rigidum TaxID=89674 RepID=UPI001F5DC9B0|nr:uncharacterized protein LOC124650143 [Lolium rigidum]XP_047045657.1 uncharacterized protein LOC124650143 [Lolium rigidum]
MMAESRGPGFNPIRGGDDPESTTESPPRPLSDPWMPLASPPRRRQSSESDSGSALERSARGRKRKRVTEPRDSASSGSVSSAYSSPLREPKAPLVPLTDEDGSVSYFFTSDKAAVDKYYDDVEKYDAKMARHERLLTSGRSSITERYSPKDTEAVITYGKSVLTLSSYQDGKVMNQCAGIVVEVDAVKNAAVILTSAWIICSKKPLDDWKNKEYDPEAKVNVHMLDGSVVECRLMYFSKHYEIAYFEIPQASQLQTLSLECNVEFDQDVFLLARDTDLNLIYKRDKVQLVDPCEHQHNHYQFVHGPIPECGTGGALLDLSGKVVGMLFYKLPLVAFIPSSLILKCSVMWQRFGQLARPQLGLKLGTLGFLGIPRVDFMSRNFNISSGLIVGEISAKCDAEKLGIRAGDVIFSCQKNRVSSIVQLENVLLGVGEKHLEKSNDLSSEVDVEIGVFHVRKRTQSVVTLRVELSDHLELFHSDDADAKAVGSKGEEAPVSAAGEADP